MIARMAKRTTIPWRSRWSRALGTALLALLAIPVGPQFVRAADPVPPQPPLSSSALAALEYQETAYSLNNLGISISRQAAVFKHEPAAVAGKVIRGTLNFGDNATNAIPFLWQRDAGKLFLDLNRNQDLTDDPAGVFSAHLMAPLNYQYQTFTNVHLLFTTSLGPCPVLADLNFYDYGAASGCSVSLRSFWQGKLTLSGQDWQVGVVPTIWVGKNGHRDVSIENGHLLLRPWEKRVKDFNVINGSLDTVPFSQKLFFDGHAYQLNWLPGPNPGMATRPALQASLQFAEQSVPLGELKITGKYIQRLTLSGNSGNPWFAVLDQPAGTVRVPTGSYTQPNIQLEQNGVQAWCNPNSWPVARLASVQVNGTTPATLDVGGPLTNSVSVTRHGSDLRLNYQLLGAGGQTYQLANVDRSKPPEFAIYHDGTKLASGNFEFG